LGYEFAELSQTGLALAKIAKGESIPWKLMILLGDLGDLGERIFRSPLL
jgi:hypothetical protein